MDGDLFGAPLTTPTERPKTTPAKGYAALPGTGPAGETCKTCRYHCVIAYSRNYHKCLLMRPFWTSGPGTDIRVKSPACKLWERAE
jgi:hypothetical protein